MKMHARPRIIHPLSVSPVIVNCSRTASDPSRSVQQIFVEKIEKTKAKASSYHKSPVGACYHMEHAHGRNPRHWKGSWKYYRACMTTRANRHRATAVQLWTGTNIRINNRYTCTWIIIYLSKLMGKSQSQASRNGARTGDLLSKS